MNIVRSAVYGVACLAFCVSLGAATHTVEIRNFSFTPSELTIALGDTVTWVWIDTHHSTTRTGQPESWDSGVVMQAGFQFSHTFQTAGTFGYVCSPHAAFMSGTIIVEPPSKADTTTSLTSSKNPSTAGESVTFTANVQGTGGSPTGTVTFFDGVATLCSDVPLSGGSAGCTKSSLGTGTHTITAAYPGDDDFNGSTSPPLTQTVNSAPAAPASITATAVSASEVLITWSAVSGATSYEVVRSSNNGLYEGLPMTSATSINDPGRAANTTYLYKVRAILPSGPSAFTGPDPATTVVFTDPSLSGAIIKAVHVSELRTAVNAMRASAGLGPFAFTDHPLAAGTKVKAVHLAELRSALDAARAAIGLPALSYTNATLTPAVTVVRAAHALELRGGTQ